MTQTINPPTEELDTQRLEEFVGRFASDLGAVLHATLRHIAKEGRVYVLGVTSCLRGSDVPRDLPRADQMYGGEHDWMARGNTTICGPEGEILAGPLEGEEGISYAEIDVDHAHKVRRYFDPAGHYARPDVLRLVADLEVKSVFAREERDAAPQPDRDTVAGG